MLLLPISVVPRSLRAQSSAPSWPGPEATILRTRAFFNGRPVVALDPQAGAQIRGISRPRLHLRAFSGQSQCASALARLGLEGGRPLAEARHVAELDRFVAAHQI